MIEFYGYNKCSTCLKAKKTLAKNGVAFDDIDITQNPPSQTLLKKILGEGRYELKDLFNKSGEVYRSLNMKDKLKTMSQSDALALLAKEGKLVKRPIVSNGKTFTVGFDEDTFTSVWR
jgi:arsenate reductase